MSKTETARGKYGILAVYTESSNHEWENEDKTVAYDIEINDFVDYINDILTNNYDADVSVAFPRLDEREIKKQVRSWCDKDETVDEPADTIFVVGYPDFSDSPENINDVIETVQRIIRKQVTKDYRNAKEIMKELELKFHRSVLGIRDETLIFNLFGFYKEEVIKCIDIIITHAERRRAMMTMCTQQQASLSSSNNNNEDPAGESRVHRKSVRSRCTKQESTIKDSEVSTFSSASSSTKKSAMNKRKYHYSLPPDKSMQKESATNEEKRSLSLAKSILPKQSSCSPDKSLEKFYYDVIVKKKDIDQDAEEYQRFSLDLSTERIDITSIGAKPKKVQTKTSEIESNNANHKSHVSDWGSKVTREGISPFELMGDHCAIDNKSSDSSVPALDKLNIKSHESHISDRKYELMEEAISPFELMDKCCASDNKSSDSSVPALDKLNIKSHESHISDRKYELMEEAISPFELMDECCASDYKSCDSSVPSPEKINDETSQEEHLSSDNASSSSSDRESSLSDFIMDEEVEGVIYKKYPVITVADALSKIEKVIKTEKSVRSYNFIRTGEAHGRILAEPVRSDCDVPAFRVATKHGFAVLASDGVGKRIVLSKTTMPNETLIISGTCMYVKSGDYVPDEATAVVRLKDVKRVTSDPGSKIILVKIKPTFGQNIKDIGSEIKRKKLIIKPFTRIGPSELGLLAAIDRQKVLVIEHVSIGILSIGNWLLEPGRLLKPGYVYDSNRISLIALLKDKGFNSIVDFGIVSEKMIPVMKKIIEALRQVDLLVTVGCSSDNDLLKIILVNNFDATIHFGNVFMKPGKSTTFATCMIDNKLKCFLCLPKNPVSASVSAHLFLLPIVNALHNMFDEPSIIPACVQDRYILHPRPRAAWAKLRWNEEDNFATASSKENLHSDKLHSCQDADVLLWLPEKTLNQQVMSTSFVPAWPTK